MARQDVETRLVGISQLPSLEMNPPGGTIQSCEYLSNKIKSTISQSHHTRSHISQVRPKSQREASIANFKLPSPLLLHPLSHLRDVLKNSVNSAVHLTLPDESHNQYNISDRPSIIYQQSVQTPSRSPMANEENLSD
jgi:hypothetical protein